MRNARSTLAATVLILTACSAQVAVTVDDTADREAIMAVRDMEVATLQSGDRSMSYTTEDFSMMPPGAPMSVGREAAQAWAEEFMSAVTVEHIAYDESNLVISGNWAIERYTGTVTLVMGEGGEPTTETVKGVHIYRKGEDGGWKMALDIWNNDTAPAPM